RNTDKFVFIIRVVSTSGYITVIINLMGNTGEDIASLFRDGCMFGDFKFTAGKETTAVAHALNNISMQFFRIKTDFYEICSYSGVVKAGIFVMFVNIVPGKFTFVFGADI